MRDNLYNRTGRIILSLYYAPSAQASDECKIVGWGSLYFRLIFINLRFSSRVFTLFNTINKHPCEWPCGLYRLYKLHPLPATTNSYSFFSRSTIQQQHQITFIVPFESFIATGCSWFLFDYSFVTVAESAPAQIIINRLDSLSLVYA